MELLQTFNEELQAIITSISLTIKSGDDGTSEEATVDEWARRIVSPDEHRQGGCVPANKSREQYPGQDEPGSRDVVVMFRFDHIKAKSARKTLLSLADQV